MRFFVLNKSPCLTKGFYSSLYFLRDTVILYCLSALSEFIHKSAGLSHPPHTQSLLHTSLLASLIHHIHNHCYTQVCWPLSSTTYTITATHKSAGLSHPPHTQSLLHTSLHHIHNHCYTQVCWPLSSTTYTITATLHQTTWHTTWYTT